MAVAAARVRLRITRPAATGNLLQLIFGQFYGIKEVFNFILRITRMTPRGHPLVWSTTPSFSTVLEKGVWMQDKEFCRPWNNRLVQLFTTARPTMTRLSLPRSQNSVRRAPGLLACDRHLGGRNGAAESRDWPCRRMVELGRLQAVAQSCPEPTPAIEHWWKEEQDSSYGLPCFLSQACISSISFSFCRMVFSIIWRSSGSVMSLRPSREMSTAP